MSLARRDEIALRLEAGDAAAIDPQREAQRRRAGAAADIEYGVARFRRHRGRQQHRIDGGAVAVARLAQPHPAAEQRVLAERRLGRGRGQPAASPASASTRAGAAMIVLADHEAARDSADAALDDAGMSVEHDALDAGVGKQCLQP